MVSSLCLGRVSLDNYEGWDWADEKVVFPSLDPVPLLLYSKDQNRYLKHSWLDTISLPLNSVHSPRTNSAKLQPTSTPTLSLPVNALSRHQVSLPVKVCSSPQPMKKPSKP